MRRVLVLVVSFCENLTVLVWDMLSMCVLIFLQHSMHKKQQVFGTLELLLLHVFAENRRTCWKEPWNTCISLSTNTVPTDPYVMIKVLVLEGQLRHISRRLVQSNNNTKQWFDTRLLQLIQWQCWNWLFSTSTVYTMSNIVCPESCTENQLTFVAGSQYFSEVTTWLISHRAPIIQARLISLEEAPIRWLVASMPAGEIESLSKLVPCQHSLSGKTYQTVLRVINFNN